MWKNYEDRLTDEKSDIFGKMFSLSASRYAYDSVYYINSIMTTGKLKDMVMNDERTEWCDEFFLSAVFNREVPYKQGEVLDSFTLWFIGYLYKYWMRTRKLSPTEVIEILPAEEFIKRFGFYHTQGWEYIISDATKNQLSHNQQNL